MTVSVPFGEALQVPESGAPLEEVIAKAKAGSALSEADAPSLLAAGPALALVAHGGGGVADRTSSIRTGSKQ